MGDNCSLLYHHFADNKQFLNTAQQQLWEQTLQSRFSAAERPEMQCYDMWEHHPYSLETEKAQHGREQIESKGIRSLTVYSIPLWLERPTERWQRATAAFCLFIPCSY